LFSADKRGSFFGTVMMSNKQDFSLKLLEEGHAKIHVMGNERRLPSNMAELESTEAQAKAKELGIWSKSLRLVSESATTATVTKKYAFLERITVEVTNAVDGRNFHVRVLDKNAHYLKIEKLMEKFDSSKSEELQKPVQKGTLCAAKYQADGKWYRAKVINVLGKGQLEL
jgi:hypothetical protein